MITTSSSSPPKLFESTPSVSVRRPHKEVVNALVELHDGSFVSCSSDKTAKRWLTKNNELQILGIYKGHSEYVWCVIEKDDNTLLTGSFDQTMKFGTQPLASVSTIFRWILQFGVS